MVKGVAERLRHTWLFGICLVEPYLRIKCYTTLRRKINKCLKNLLLSKQQRYTVNKHQLPLQQWRNNISVFLEELKQIGRQSQIVAQRRHLSLWSYYKEPATQHIWAAHFSDISLLCNSPAALKSSSGGFTPVRQWKKRAAQRRKGSIPFFTLSTTELLDTSKSLKSKLHLSLEKGHCLKVNDINTKRN